MQKNSLRIQKSFVFANLTIVNYMLNGLAL